MSPELDDALCRDFPILYADRHEDPWTTLMCWGFECGSGWEPLIRELSEKLENYNKTLILSGMEPIKAVQVKEKFGALRFYLSAYDEETRTLVSAAEATSTTICEDCGAPGKTRPTRWIRTLCSECYILNLEKRNKDLETQIRALQQHDEEINLIIKFDTDDAAMHFASWLCESGEQQYWDWMTYREREEDGDITAVVFDYHNQNESKDQDDESRYNEFMSDWTIRTRLGRLDGTNEV